MKVYESKDVRNIAVVGHSHAGKTSLVSAMLFTGAAGPRLGRVDDGSTITDYDEEEIARKMTISTGVAHLEWGAASVNAGNKVKINILDTPGFNMFVHEAKSAMIPSESVVVV